MVVFFNFSFTCRGMRWQQISVFGTFVWGAWSCWVGELPASNIHANASLYWHKRPKWKSVLQWGLVMQILKINIHKHWYLCDNQYNMELLFKHILSNIQGVCWAQLMQVVTRTLGPYGCRIEHLDHDSLRQLANSPTGTKNNWSTVFPSVNMGIRTLPVS